MIKSVYPGTYLTIKVIEYFREDGYTREDLVRKESLICLELGISRDTFQKCLSEVYGIVQGRVPGYVPH